MRLLLGPCVALLVAACGSDASAPHAEVPADAAVRAEAAVLVDAASPPDASPMPDASAPVDAGPMPWTTIFTIVLENHDYAEIVGSGDAPYINKLISMGALATRYSDSGTHPSLPNYLTLISGDRQYPGIVDVGPNFIGYFPSKSDNLGNQLETAKISWRSYQESMGAACKLSSAGTYATKHDPFLYFDDIQNGAASLCASRNVDFSQFATDLAAGTYRYMWITPNLINDGHDPSNDPVTGLKQSDAWLSKEVPKILASATYLAGGALFITWDEAEGRNGDSKDQVPMIVLSPHLIAPGSKTSDALSHKSYLATVEDLLKLPRLATVTSEPAMTALFK